MKKMKFLVVTFILFFCLGMKNSLSADALQEPFEIYANTDISAHSAIVLNSGYYLFGEIGKSLNEDYFTGDFEYYYQSPGGFQVELQEIHVEMNISFDINLLPLQNPFYETFTSQNIKTYGIHVIHVKSYAVFATEKELNKITAYGALDQTPNTNCSIAGNMTHFVNYDTPTSLAEIKARYHATDNVDGDITNRLIFETNYNPSTVVIGTYYIIVHVKDSANNITYAADLICVKDLSAPSISLTTSEQIIEVKTVFTSEDAKKLFSATDNQTPQNAIQWEFIDTYNSQYNTIGIYTITGTASDLENNHSSATLTIHVVDTTKPNLFLTAGGDTIYADHILSDNEIRALFSVSDNYYSLSNSTIKIIENTCTGVQGKEYRLKVSITDGSNNTFEQTFKYYLADTESPIIMVEKTIYVPLGSTFSNEQIIEMMKTAGVLSPEAVDIALSSTEAISYTKEGIYEINYIETLKDGTQKEGKLKLNIFDPVEAPNATNAVSKFNSWYYLLLLLPISLAILFFIFKNKKHEKN